MVAPRVAVLLIFGQVVCAGCAGLQDAEYAVANWTRSELCWIGNTTAGERWAYSCDYEKGWKAGFYDSSTGKACGLPAVPPPCYWSHKYQDCDGQRAISDWYRGYQCGVTVAESKGFPAFHKVPLGPQAPVVNLSGCGACFTPNGCSGVSAEMPLHMNEQPQGKFIGDSLGLIGPSGSSINRADECEVRTASAEQTWIR